MSDPYKMVLTNIFSSVVLIAFLVLWKLKYKKKINLLTLLLFISILPIINTFRPGVYESGDFNIHIYRAIDFYTSLSEGNIMPSWAGNLNAGYGYPLFVFNYTLPYYIFAFFHFLGFSFITSMKLFLISTYIASGLFMYVFVRKLTKNDLSAFTAGVFYLFAPYHLIDLNFKVVIGELLSFTLLPLFFYGLLELNSKKNLFYFGLSSLLFAFLIASHVIIALFGAVLAISFFSFKFLKSRFVKILALDLLTLVFGAVIGIYIWAAPFFMNSYTFIQNMEPKLLPFPDFASLFYSPWRFGLLFQGPMGEISNLIGYIQLFVIFLLVFQLLTKRLSKNTKNDVIFWLIATFFVFFMLTPPSSYIWNTVPFIKVVGQHRMLLLISFTISMCSAYLALNFTTKKLLIYTIITLAIGTTILNWGQRAVEEDVTDETLVEMLPMSTYEGEHHFYANSRWADINNPWFNKIPKRPIEILSGTGEIDEIGRNSTHHTYRIYAQTELKVRENTLFFPGWEVKADALDIKLEPGTRGIMEISLPKGSYNLLVRYRDISLLKKLKTISLATFASVFVLLTFLLCRKRA